MSGNAIHKIISDKGTYFVLNNGSTDSYASPLFKDAEGLAGYISNPNSSELSREGWLHEAKTTKHVFTVTEERIRQVLSIIDKFEQNLFVTADEKVMFYEFYQFLHSTIISHSDIFRPSLLDFEKSTSSELQDIIYYLSGKQYLESLGGIFAGPSTKKVDIGIQRIAVILYKKIICQSGLLNGDGSALEFAMKYRDWEFAGKV